MLTALNYRHNSSHTMLLTSPFSIRINNRANFLAHTMTHFDPHQQLMMRSTMTLMTQIMNQNLNTKSNPSSNTDLPHIVQHAFSVREQLLRSTNPNDYEFLIKWKGYPSYESTWEPFQNLTHMPDVLRQYLTSQGLPTSWLEQPDRDNPPVSTHN